jgi:hypothetical protein
MLAYMTDDLHALLEMKELASVVLTKSAFRAGLLEDQARRALHHQYVGEHCRP